MEYDENESKKNYFAMHSEGDCAAAGSVIIRQMRYSKIHLDALSRTKIFAWKIIFFFLNFMKF